MCHFTALIDLIRAKRPRDARIWQEVATCYQKLYRLVVHFILDLYFSCPVISFHEAADCLKRALAVAARDDTTIKFKLAGIYETLEDPATATAYHLQYIEACERLGKGVSEYARSCIIASKYLLSVGSPADTDFAFSLLRKTANSNAEENQQAKELLAKLES